MPSRRHPSASGLVRQIYEERPYPSTAPGIVARPPWRIAPLPWINALWNADERNPSPARVLVAGCGTGSEAFALQRKFPEAEIVAVDFSRRSIAIARDLQQRAGPTRSIRFEVADLTQRTLPRVLDGQFDLVTCHGVLSYIPHPERALATLARCLGPDGALYLGVNGTRHGSATGRRFLQSFGIDVGEYREESRIRQLLKLFDSLDFSDARTPLAGKSPGYLASDFFGPVIHNLPLAEWAQMAATAGFHFQGSLWASHNLLRAAEDPDLPALLMPRSRAEVCQLLDIVLPARFHHLLFTATPVPEAPWNDHGRLLDSRAIWTGLYQCRIPTRATSSKAPRAVTLKSPTMNTQLEWNLPEWSIEILRQSRRGGSISDIYSKKTSRPSAKLLREHLYLLHQLAVLTVLPSA